MDTLEKNLRNVIKANALFSLTSGTSLLVFAETIARIMNIANANILIIIGVGLLLFVGFLLYNAYRKEINPKQVQFIILQDWLWVITSAILLAFDPFNISLMGNVIIGAVACLVMLFAILQNFLEKSIRRKSSNNKRGL